MKSKKKRSIALMLSGILGLFYSIYIIAYFAGNFLSSTSGMEAMGSAIATALVTPHMICVVVATIFNIVAYFGNKRGFALTGAILYCVAAITFLLYAIFVLPSIILSFVGYARLGKLAQAVPDCEL